MWRNLRNIRKWMTNTPLRTAVTFYLIVVPSYVISRLLTDTKDFSANVGSEIIFGLTVGFVLALVIFLLALGRTIRQK